MSDSKTSKTRFYSFVDNETGTEFAAEGATEAAALRNALGNRFVSMGVADQRAMLRIARKGIAYYADGAVEYGTELGAKPAKEPEPAAPIQSQANEGKTPPPVSDAAKARLDRQLGAAEQGGA
ncbi:MAG: hypothetical protein KDJ29_02290 [Hyphomicrobiales bacterium]|nr:hypothetical protein [Hyphomicrobiales bacterium]